MSGPRNESACERYSGKLLLKAWQPDAYSARRQFRDGFLNLCVD